MPNINWLDVEAKPDGGGFEELPAGAYVCAITKAESDPVKQYVVLEFDVMEGPHAEAFKNTQYPPRMWLSWKRGALPMTKGRLETIQADNPGFDALAAFNNNPDLFKARKCGVVFRAEEYVDRKTMEVRMGSPRPDRIVPVADVRAGKIAAPKPRILSDERVAELGGHRPDAPDQSAQVPAGPTPSDLDGEDVPF